MLDKNIFHIFWSIGILLILALALPTVTIAKDPAPAKEAATAKDSTANKKKGTDDKSSKKNTPAEFGGKWGSTEEEANAALALKGIVEDGKKIYEGVCEGCHQPGANGDPSGNFPQLAGQHTTVIIKQMADIRAGNRDNPTMYPFANIEAMRAATEDLFEKPKSGPQAMADVAAYIQTLPMNMDTAKGPGTNLDLGKAVYQEHCTRCHGDHGEGSNKDYYPVISGQNFHYLVRQFQWIKEGKRRNANPDMVKQIQTFTPEQIEAVLDYTSRTKK